MNSRSLRITRGLPNSRTLVSVREIDKTRPQAAAVDPVIPPGTGLGATLARTRSGGEPPRAAVDAGPAAKRSREAIAAEASPNGRTERTVGGRAVPAPQLSMSRSPGHASS